MPTSSNTTTQLPPTAMLQTPDHKKQIVFLEDTLKRYVPNTLKEVAGDQYYFFARTMFPTLDVVHDLGYHEHIWAKYLETIIIIEEKLARDYFSDSLMETLR